MIDPVKSKQMFTNSQYQRPAAACQNKPMTTNAWPHEVVQTEEGDQLCMWRPNGVEPPARLHFAHATGFHAHTYAPLFAQLADIPLAAWDMRGHGASAEAGDLRRFKSWHIYARDLGAWLRQQESPVWLAGHSVGATVSAELAASHPDKVRGLILIEPVFMSRKLGWMLRAGRLTRSRSHNPLAVGALRRRNAFDSLEMVYRAYRGRGAFKTWPEEWLSAYIEHAFQAEGDVLKLRCDPRWESRSFELTVPNPWDFVRKLKVPTHVFLGGTEHSTTNADARRTLQALCPLAQLEQWPDATHFLPMECTAELAARIRTLIEAV